MFACELEVVKQFTLKIKQNKLGIEKKCKVNAFFISYLQNT